MALQSFRAADRQVGGGHLYVTVSDYLHTAVGPRLFGHADDEHGTLMFGAAAILTDMVGWMAYDAGQDALAERHFARASDLASVSGDQQLCAHILASRSNLAQHLGKPDEAIKLARAGQEQARRGPGNPELDARLYAMEAHGFADRHESVECARLLIHSEETLARSSSGNPSEWISRFDEASLAMEAARCLRQLGQYAQARREAERVVALRAGDRTRSRAFGQLILAVVLVKQGAPDEACAVGSEVVEATQALGSFRVVEQLHGLAQLLEPYRSAKAVTDFLAYLTEEIRRRMWLYRWFSVTCHARATSG